MYNKSLLLWESKPQPWLVGGLEEAFADKRNKLNCVQRFTHRNERLRIIVKEFQLIKQNTERERENGLWRSVELLGESQIRCPSW